MKLVSLQHFLLLLCQRELGGSKKSQMISVIKTKINTVGDLSLDSTVFHLFEDWHHVFDVVGGGRVFL